VTSRALTAALLALALALALAASACGGGSVYTRGQKARVVAKPKLRPVRQEALRDFDAGLRALKLGGPEADERAAEKFLAATKKDPTLWEAWHNIGIIDARIGDDAGAVDAFSNALRVNPAHAPALLGRAEANRRLHRIGAARADYKEALARDPQDSGTLLRFASMQREANDLDGALKSVREALRINANDARAYVELGLLYLAGGRQELAEFVLTKATELDARSPQAWNALAMLSLARGDDQEAFERFDQASALDPSFRDARFNKATVLLNAGDYARAASELEAVVGLDARDVEAWVALGVAYRGQGKHPKAKEAWLKVLEIAPKNADALWNLTVLSQDFLQDEAAARDYLARYMHVAGPDHPRRKDADSRSKELGAGASKSPAPAAKPARPNKQKGK
jgi:Tfp pilus assembly protein PilF